VNISSEQTMALLRAASQLQLDSIDVCSQRMRCRAVPCGDARCMLRRFHRKANGTTQTVHVNKSARVLTVFALTLS